MRSPDMLQGIHRFVDALRRAGVVIAPSELVDALQAVRDVGVEDPGRFRRALRVTLVKRSRDLPTFERVFDGHFRAPRGTGRGKRRERGEPSPGGTGIRHRQRDDTPDPWRRAARSERLERRRRQAEPERRRPGRIRFLLSPRLERAVHPRERRHRPGPPSRRAVDEERSGTPAGRRSRTVDWTRVDLSRDLDPEEERRLAEQIPRLIRTIRLRAGRRWRPRTRGRPWPARILRRSLGTGGVPFVIPARRPRERHPRVVVMADVSWSVLRACAFFLTIAKSFLEERGRTSIHLFVDRCVDVTRHLGRWETTSAFEGFVGTIPDLDPRAPSDYGRAFHQAAFGHQNLAGHLGRDGVLIVLGDARNNRRDPQSWAFEELASRARSVIWLDPEPEALWETGDSDLAVYMPHCDVVCETRDLEGLARGVAAILKCL